MRSCSLHGCSRSVRLSSPVTGTVATRISPGSRSNPVDKVMGTVSRNCHCSSSLHTSERRENEADVALTTLGRTKRSREQRSVHFRIRSVITIWSHSTVTALTLIRSCSDSRSAISILLRIPHSAFRISHSAFRMLSPRQAGKSATPIKRISHRLTGLCYPPSNGCQISSRSSRRDRAEGL